MTAPIEPEHLHPADKHGTEESKAEPCPRDTDGDGDCGQRSCPNCRRHREMHRRTGDARPQQWGLESY